jgi:hypothetical protein
MENMRKEIQSFISWNYGPSAWEEVLHIEAQMRKQRKEELYRKEELKQKIIEWIAGILIVSSASVILGLFIFFLGRKQGKW